MKMRNILNYVSERILNYNVFIPEEDEYDDDNDELQNPATLLKQQRYATRIYVPLLISKQS